MFLLDQRVFQFLYMTAYRNAFWNVFAIFFAEYLPYLMVVAFLVLVYYQNGWRRKVYLFCEAALAIILSRGIVTEVIRYFYHEPRPFSFYGLAPLFNETSWSFPSGHAAWFFALAMVAWFANRKWGWWYFLLALLMGVARVYAGVHWPIDIVGGAVTGIASALFIHWLLKRSGKDLSI
jgi:undecaprenyl-diphosphatase